MLAPSSPRFSGRRYRLARQHLALKTYGAIIADNGSSWYISGTPDDRWNNDQLQSLSVLTGGDFEAVDTSDLRVSPESGAARTP